MKDLYISTRHAMGIPINYMLKKSRGKKGRRTSDDPVTCVAKIEHNRKAAILWDIWTEPAYRGHGHAKALLDKVCSLYDRVWTGWTDSTEGGRKLCLSCGFTKVKKSGEWYLLWEKKHESKGDGDEGTAKEIGGEVGSESEGDEQARDEG